MLMCAVPLSTPVLTLEPLRVDHWVIVERGADEAVGFVQATLRDAAPNTDTHCSTAPPSSTRSAPVTQPSWSAELAWVVGAPCQGRGYATAAVRAVQQWLRDQGATDFVAHIADANIPSRRVALAVALAPTDEFVDGERVWRNLSRVPGAGASGRASDRT
jgi:RimJ/RimL family protein N-acetyltransferase